MFARIASCGSRAAASSSALVAAPAMHAAPAGGAARAALRPRRLAPPGHHRLARGAALLRSGAGLTYGFNHAQAIAAFTEAAKLDPRCAMAWWGIALAHGPNINLPMDSPTRRPAWEALAEGARARAGGERRASSALHRRAREALRRPTPRRRPRGAGLGLRGRDARGREALSRRRRRGARCSPRR